MAAIVFSAALSCGKGGEGGRGLVKENDRITTVDLGRVNAYLLKAADGFILIDMGMPGQWNMLEKSLKNAGCLADGQSLKEYGSDAVIHHVPGHTAGSIAILTPEGDLFVGDTVFHFAGPETAIFIQNKKELRESLYRLKTLDAKTVYPGHGRPFPMDQLKKLSL